MKPGNHMWIAESSTDGVIGMVALEKNKEAAVSESNECLK